MFKVLMRCAVIALALLPIAFVTPGLTFPDNTVVSRELLRAAKSEIAKLRASE